MTGNDELSTYTSLLKKYSYKSIKKIQKLYKNVSNKYYLQSLFHSYKQYSFKNTTEYKFLLSHFIFLKELAKHIASIPLAVSQNTADTQDIFLIDFQENLKRSLHNFI